MSWAEGKEGSEYWYVTYWTRDELVFHISGDPNEMEAMIRAFA